MTFSRNEKLTKLRLKKIELEAIKRPSSEALLVMKTINREILEILEEEKR